MRETSHTAPGSGIGPLNCSDQALASHAIILARRTSMNTVQLRELLLQSLEHERGGVKIYRSALKCALREDLRSEWTEYLAQTEHHVEVLTNVCTQLGID